MKEKKVFFLILRICFSVFLLGLLFWLMRNSMADILSVLGSANIKLLSLAPLVLFLAVFFAALRIRGLFLVQNIHFSIAESLKLSLVGLFFNNFMPSTVGGDVIKLYYAKKRSNSFMKPFGSIFLDRFIGMTAKIFLAFLSLIFWGSLIKNVMIKWLIIALAGFLLVFIILILWKRFRAKIVALLSKFHFDKAKDKLEQAHAIASEFRRSPEIIKAFILSCLMQVIMIFGVYILACSLSLNLPVYIFFVFIPVIEIVSSLPSINGLGIREGAFVYFFRDFVSLELAFSLSILFAAQMIFVSLIGGLVYLFQGDINKKEVFDVKQGIT